MFLCVKKLTHFDGAMKIGKIQVSFSHIVGNPRNYGPTKEELEEEELRRCEEKMRREMEESAKREEMMREEEDKLRRRKMEWVSC